MKPKMPRDVAAVMVSNRFALGHEYGAERVRGHEPYDAFRNGLWKTLDSPATFNKCDEFFRSPRGVPFLNETIAVMEEFYAANRPTFIAEKRDFERRHPQGS